MVTSGVGTFPKGESHGARFIFIYSYTPLLKPGLYKDSPGIWMIHIVEELELLLLYNLIYINLLMYVVGVIEDWDT
jgi:hypothetical protein